MRYRLLVLLISLCIVVLFAAATHVVCEFVVSEGIETVEISEAEDSVKQLETFLKISSLRLYSLTRDWAYWDEAYRFIIDKDENFIRSNLSLERFRQLKIATAAFFDDRGKEVAFIDAADREYGEAWLREEKAVIQRFVEKLGTSGEESMQGYARVGDGVILVAAHKIYDGGREQASNGVLALVKVLDENFVTMTSAVTNISFALRPVATYTAVPVRESAFALHKFVVQPETITAYALVNDFLGKPAFCLEVTGHRTYSSLGQMVTKKNFWLVLALGLCILPTGLFFLHRVQRQIVHSEMSYRMEHDSLTGLPNKPLFLKRLQTFLRIAHRENRTVGVLFIDLDRFKRVNNSYGTAQGDTVLCEVAERLNNGLSGCVARQSGDEFFLAVIEDGPEKITALAEESLELIHMPFVMRGGNLHLGASIGLACQSDANISPDVLLHRAEVAMYEAKESGGDAIVTFSLAMDEEAARKKRLETALYAAIEREELTVHYQPKVDIVRQDVAGCEALIRWKKKDGTTVFPSTFIPLAEEIGLITKIDMFVLRSACRQITAWRKDGIAVPIAVNMSVKSILSQGFADQVIGILQEEHTPTSLIDIEITESSFISDLDTAFSAISRLHEAGIHIALDDFGTGYSSLQYLSAMPISFLKIDKKFVDDIFSGKVTAKPLVKSILALAYNLGMHTISEGVEKKSQLEFLAANGAKIIQGYIFSKPLNDVDFSDFLRNQKARIAAVMNVA